MAALCHLTGELGLAQSVHESESIFCSKKETIFVKRDNIQTMARIKIMHCNDEENIMMMRPVVVMIHNRRVLS